MPTNHPSINQHKQIRDILSYIPFDTSVILFDLDNTVFCPYEYLGSDQWFCRLFQYVGECVQSPQIQKVLSVAIYNEVIQRIEMKTVEPVITKLINALQDIGFPVLAITSRGPKLAQTTKTQLKKMGIRFDHTFFCAGQNKGQVLASAIPFLHKKWTKAVMVDDKKEHLDAVRDVLLANNIAFQGIRYSRMDEAFQQEDTLKTLKDSLRNFHFFSPELKQNVNLILNASNPNPQCTIL